jgi:hypothetical protein
MSGAEASAEALTLSEEKGEGQPMHRAAVSLRSSQA